MRTFLAVRLLSILTFLNITCGIGNAGQPISPDTKKLEEKMAVINAGRIVPADDTTVFRFRFLLSQLSLASGETEKDIADKISVARRALLEEFGKNVGLLEFTEAAYRSQSAIGRGRFSEHVSHLVVLMGSN